MLRLLSKVTVASTAAYVAYDSTTREKNILRCARTIRCGLNVLYQYKIRFSAENSNEVHEIVARDIYETCKENDGLYVKLAQGLSAMEHILPPPYLKYLSKLQDEAKASPYDQIEEIFVKDMGKKPEEFFDGFTKEPIASASIAQVHKAKIKNTQTEVAVKIQKPNIKGQFWFDMHMHWLICAVLQYSFNLPLLPFTEFIEENLAKEINFKTEAENMEKARFFMESHNNTPNIYIPKIFSEFTRDRILVTEWIDGVKVTHFDEVKSLTSSGIKPIVTDIIDFFAKQIFEHGFVHCDPHPGNILIQKGQQKNQKYRIAIIDFGLCIELNDKIKKEYCEFWKGILDSDSKKLEEITKKWGMNDFESFVGATMMKPYNSKKKLSDRPTKNEIYEMQLKFKKQLDKQMNNFSNLPKELIFVGRNMNLIRSLNKKAGSIVDRISMLAEESNRCYWTYYHYGKKAGLLQLLTLRLKFFVLSLVYDFFALFSKKKFEDFIEDEMKKATEDFYESYGFKVDEKTFDA
jgi:aarF domain-containing kinase